MQEWQAALDRVELLKDTAAKGDQAYQQVNLVCSMCLHCRQTGDWAALHGHVTLTQNLVNVMFKMHGSPTLVMGKHRYCRASVVQRLASVESAWY